MTKKTTRDPATMIEVLVRKLFSFSFESIADRILFPAITRQIPIITTNEVIAARAKSHQLACLKKRSQRRRAAMKANREATEANIAIHLARLAT